jgi:hypothetical protein
MLFPQDDAKLGASNGSTEWAYWDFPMHFTEYSVQRPRVGGDPEIEPRQRPSPALSCLSSGSSV